MSLEERFGLLRSAFVQRNKFAPPAAFQRLLVFPGVGKKMLERREQERTEFSQLSIGPEMDFVFDQIRKKTLG